MKYSAQMVSGAMIRIPSLIKISSHKQKLHRDTDRKEIAKAYFRKVG
jgi:hypothetical protein